MSTFYILRPWREQLLGPHFAYGGPMDPAVYGARTLHGICPVCGDGLGLGRWIPPHLIRLSNTRYPDFLWGAGFPLMVTERFVDLYERNALTGVRTFDPPAEILQVGRKPPDLVVPRPPAYHHVLYIYDGANLDDEQSGAVRQPEHWKCGYCRQAIHAVDRVVFDPLSWTGADLFEAYGMPGVIVISERLRNLVKEHGLSGADMVPADQYAFSYSQLPAEFYLKNRPPGGW